MKWAHALHVAAVVWLALTALYMATTNWPLFAQYTYEDQALEHAQFIFYVLTCALCCLITSELRQKKQYATAFLMGIGALLFFVTAMEEISWGMRFYQITPPDFFLYHNKQHEINLHNMIGGEEMRFFYVAVGCYGALSGWAYLLVERYDSDSQKWLHQPIQLKFLTIPTYHSVYFIPIATTQILRPMRDRILWFGGEAWRWQEVNEFFLALGCFLACFFHLRELLRCPQISAGKG